MGKSSAPNPPDYKGQAVATGNSGKYNESGPTGAVNWSTRPGADPSNPLPGDYIRTTTLAPEQQQLYDQGVGNQLQAGLVGQHQLQDLQGGQQGTQDALYRRATQYYDQRFGQQEDALKTQLQNQGLVEGSQAWHNAMQDFNQNKNTAYADATDRAIAGSNTSQNDAVARLANILAMSKGQNPTSGNSAGGAPTDLLSAANQAYQAQVAGVNAGNAETAGTTNAAMSAAMMALMYFSDRRLKSRIQPVSGGRCNLQAYTYTIMGQQERGYMADEVQAICPEAVHTHPSGYLMVNYTMLGGRP